MSADSSKTSSSQFPATPNILCRRWLYGMYTLLALILAASATVPAYAQTKNALPALLQDVGIDQKLNEQIPLDLVFRDESGRSVQLREFFGKKPVLLTLVYYECPMLCTLVLNGVVRSLRALAFTPGNEFEVLTVSFNPRETPPLAAAKKETYLARYDRRGAGKGWHFLTGDEDSIRELTKAAGFRYAYDADQKQYVHASGIMVVTPEGKMSRYFYGIEYSARELRWALVEASASKIGTHVDQVMLFCFHYDPTTGKYGLAIMNFLRLSGIATVAVLLGFIIAMLRRDRKAGALRA